MKQEIDLGIDVDKEHTCVKRVDSPKAQFDALLHYYGMSSTWHTKLG